MNEYLQSLSAELSRAGIAGGLRRRILAEISDHLECDPHAAVGSPRELARQFADELGTVRARRAAVAGFAALALAGTLFAAAFLSAARANLDWMQSHPHSRALGDLAALLALLAPQVALVSGGLAAVRAYRHQTERVIPRAEAVVIVRRATIGVAAGMLTMLGMALLGIEYGRSVANWWSALALAGAGVGVAALAAATPALLAAMRLAPLAPGDRGDLFDDLGPLVPAPLRGRDWLFACAVAALVALAITVGGVVQSDGFDGAARGIADGLACLVGFALLGRYLGLRSASVSAGNAGLGD